MRKGCAILLFLVLTAPAVWADTQDTAVFKAAMSPANEVPPVNAPGVSGFSTITVRVTRDAAGNVNAATVLFDIDYTVPAATTFTGLHIHNALPGTSGGVVINTGIGGTNTVTANGTGHITRVVNYTSSDADGLKYVTGLLDVPENYYVNIHSTTQTSGIMRAPLLRTSMTLRPQLSPSQETPTVSDDAEGAAAIQIQVIRNNAGAITSGTVTFDVDYRMPPGSTITGLHIHNAAAGSNGSVVIDSGINDSTRAIVSTTGRGNVFRITDIDSSNPAGLAVLTSLLNDPTPFYVNMQTSARPSGLMRGQLSTNSYAFFGLMSGAEENPPVPTPGTANSMTLVSVTRDNTGNIVSGTVSFNVAYSGFGGPVTFTGLHIHNAAIGVNGSVVINTGIGSGANSVTDDDGVGSVNREVAVDANTATALTAMKGLLANPEQYYVNIHTTTFGGGIIRSQLALETYHFKTTMTPANENPPITSSASATGWVTVKLSRNNLGVINSGRVIFDVDYSAGGQVTFTGLHIHTGAATANGGVVINTGLSATDPVVSNPAGGNITRVVDIGAPTAAQLAMFETLIKNPDQAYINIHTTANSAGFMRSQMLPVLNYVPQVAGGGEWISSIVITNPSTTSSVLGIVDTFNSGGAPMSSALIDPAISFLIPPSGSTTINVHNKGTLTTGFARVYSNGAVALTTNYSYPTFPTGVTVTPVTGHLLSIPVNVGSGINSTGIAMFAPTAGQLLFSLRSTSGSVIGGGSRTIDVAAGQHVVGFVRDLLPGVTEAQLSGTLTVEFRPTSGTESFAAMALQFNGVLSPVTLTVVQ
jgi:hypothetical protein